MFLTFAIYSSELVTDANIEYSFGFRVCPFWDDQGSLYFESFFSCSFQTQATLSAFVSLVLYYAFFCFEILQTIVLLILINVWLWSVNQRPRCPLYIDCSRFWILLYKIWHWTMWNFYSNFIEKITVLATIFLIWILKHIIWEFTVKSVVQNIVALIFIFLKLR